MAGSKRRIYEIHKKLVYTICLNNGENNMGFAFEVIINILEAVLIAQFFVRYFGSKVGKGSVLGKSIYAGAVIGISHFVIVTFLNYTGYYSGHQQWILDGVLLVSVILTLQGRILEKLLFVQISSVITGTTGVLFIALFQRWIIYDASGYPVFGISRILLCLGAMLIYVVFTELLIHFQVKEKQYITNNTYFKMNIIMLATQSVNNYLMEIVYINSLYDNSIREVYFVIVALVAVDVIIYMLYVELANNSIRLLKEKMKSAAYESEKKEIEKIQEIHRQTLKIRHDMKNVLLNIRLMLQDGKVHEAEQYLEEELNVKLAKVNIVSTGNRIIDAVLNSHVQQAEEEGIPLQLTVECSLGNKEEMDFAILLSNLLDNAVEAAIQCDKPYINLRITRKDDALHIEINNSCSAVVDLESQDGILPTTKHDKTVHGYGLSNVKDIVELYNGFYDYECKDGNFMTDIVLYI